MRTNFWRCWIFSATLLFAGAGAAAPAQPPTAPRPTELVPGVLLLRGVFVPGQQPDGNGVLFSAPDGWIVVDTGRHPDHTRVLLESAKPLRAVFNTHWHLDHTGGNVLVRSEAPRARIYASSALADALKGFLARSAKGLEEAIAKAEEGSAGQRTARADT
ncbi:MAG: MBL fold metallo-hydrolase [Acidobacteriota bacterium]